MLLTICKSSEKISLNHSKFFKSLSFYIHIHMCIEVRTRVSFLFPSIDQANQPHSQAGSPIAHTRADYSDPVAMSTGSEPRIPGSSDSRCLDLWIPFDGESSSQPRSHNNLQRHVKDFTWSSRKITWWL